MELNFFLVWYLFIKRPLHCSNRSPFRRPSGGDRTSDGPGSRPPLPQGGHGRAASLERPVSAMAFGGGRSIVVDPENNNVQIVRDDLKTNRATTNNRG